MANPDSEALHICETVIPILSVPSCCPWIMIALGGIVISSPPTHSYSITLGGLVSKQSVGAIDAVGLPVGDELGPADG